MSVREWGPMKHVAGRLAPRLLLRERLAGARLRLQGLIDVLTNGSDEGAELEARDLLERIGEVTAVRTRAANHDLAAPQRVEDRSGIFQALVEASPNGLLLRALPGAADPHFEFANTALRTMLGGSSPASALDHPALQLAPEVLQRLITGELEVVRTEALLSTLSGEVLPVAVSSFMVPHRGGAPWVMATTVIDTTEVHRANEERRRQSEIIARQQAELLCAKEHALTELSAPLIPIADRVLVMPLIGIVDRARIEHATQTLLEGISRFKAHTAILDLTGVKSIHTAEVRGWTTLVGAARLLGSRVILTGIHANVAAELAEVGIDLGATVHGTLQSAIRSALRRSGE